MELMMTLLLLILLNQLSSPGLHRTAKMQMEALPPLSKLMGRAKNLMIIVLRPSQKNLNNLLMTATTMMEMETKMKTKIKVTFWARDLASKNHQKRALSLLSFAVEGSTAQTTIPRKTSSKCMLAMVSRMDYATTLNPTDGWMLMSMVKSKNERGF